MKKLLVLFAMLSSPAFADVTDGQCQPNTNPCWGYVGKTVMYPTLNTGTPAITFWTSRGFSTQPLCSAAVNAIKALENDSNPRLMYIVTSACYQIQ